MSADRQIHTHTHIRQLMSYELVYTSIHSSIKSIIIDFLHTGRRLSCQRSCSVRSLSARCLRIPKRFFSQHVSHFIHDRPLYSPPPPPPPPGLPPSSTHLRRFSYIIEVRVMVYGRVMMRCISCSPLTCDIIIICRCI